VTEDDLGLVPRRRKHVPQALVPLPGRLGTRRAAVVEGHKQDAAVGEGVVGVGRAERLAERLQVLRRTLLLHDFVVADHRVERASKRLEDLPQGSQVRLEPLQRFAVDHVSDAHHEIAGRHDFSLTDRLHHPACLLVGVLVRLLSGGFDGGLRGLDVEIVDLNEAEQRLLHRSAGVLCGRLRQPPGRVEPLSRQGNEEDRQGEWEEAARRHRPLPLLGVVVNRSLTTPIISGRSGRCQARNTGSSSAGPLAGFYRVSARRLTPTGRVRENRAQFDPTSSPAAAGRRFAPQQESTQP